jgi:catechol 2,3-dioxygenase-like lactoylglutathione lyase family enzyme
MEGNYSFDHAVVVVNDLSAATADYAALGFTVTQGGEHENGQTHNALMVFPDGSSLELLGFKRRWALPALRILKRIGVLRLGVSRRPPVERRFVPKFAAGKGLMDFALLSRSIEDELDAVRRRGLAIEGPLPFGRVQPDGQRVSWLLSVPLAPDLPFLIGDVTPSRERDHHANGVEGVAGVTLGVADLDASVARYKALLGREPNEGSAITLPEARTMGFMLDSATITLAMPIGHSRHLRSHLAQRGEGPYALRLRTSNSEYVGTLDLIRTHGARLELVPK